MTLGGERPTVQGVNLRGSVGSPSAGIILLARIQPSELSSALDQAPDPAIPIADFGNNNVVRRDFVGSNFDRESIHEIERTFAPIWRRLAEFPFKAAREGRAELTTLRLAYSRDSAITAVLDPNSRRVVEYPLLGAIAGERRQLETLAGLDLLHRRHFTRTHACAKCESARLNVYEACPACGGADLREETLVHHYRCGCQEVESHFAQSHLLVCPKCHRSLHHLGVDYGKPGKVVVCATCGATNSEPIVHLACLDCSAVTPADDAVATDWYHYDLTDEGIRTLQQGRLPQFDITPLLESQTHAYSPHDFRLLAMHELKVAERFNRPFSVARFTVLNLESLVREHGPVAADIGFRRAVDAVVVALRACDFVSAGAMQSTVIGFPGTAAKDVDVIVTRIRNTVDATVTSQVELGVEVAEGDAIIDLLAEI